MDLVQIMKARATILLSLGLNALAQAELYEFTANLSYQQNGSNHDLRFTMLGDGGLVADPDNEGTEVFIFSGSGTLEYQFVPGLWFEVGNLSMELSHWPIFSWPMGSYTENDTLPPILRPNLEYGSVDGVLSGTDISKNCDGQLLKGTGTLSFAGQGQEPPLQVDVEDWSIALVPSPGVGFGLLLGGSRLKRRRRTN
ncbi:MAG: hypothetical protein VXX15_03845 [Planctomycetota bacterium]|nr:hypothetical protein [Planctomycetota bacterium]